MSDPLNPQIPASDGSDIRPNTTPTNHSTDGPDTIERRLGHRERERLERAARRHEFGRPDLTELAIGRTTHRIADVEPMDADGVLTMTVGTIAWAVVAVALVPFIGRLNEAGSGWWFWSAIAGLGLGLIGIEYCRRRRRALSQAPGGRRRAEVAAPAPRRAGGRRAQR